MEIDIYADIEELNKVFKNLPSVMRKKVYIKSLKAGGKVVKEKASENVRSITSNEATGTLAKNLAVYQLKKWQDWFRVGVRVKKKAVNKMKKDGDGNPVRVGLYASVLEYGKKGQPPRPWLRSAVREEKDNALRAVAKEMKDSMDSAIKDAKK